MANSSSDCPAANVPSLLRLGRVPSAPSTDRYKWIALSSATLAVLLATLDGSITIIAMPDIFRGIHLDPLIPANSFYLLWMILGYLVVTSVLIVSLGRLGDMTFALGLVVLAMVAVTYGVRPAGGHATGWGSARVLALVGASAISFVAFVVVERRSHDPMFRLPLFRIRAFTFGTLSTFLSAVARGGLMFMLIIWLQGSGCRSTASTSPRRRCGRASTCCH